MLKVWKDEESSNDLDTPVCVIRIGAKRSSRIQKKV
jgi:hypothetical protein